MTLMCACIVKCVCVCMCMCVSVCLCIFSGKNRYISLFLFLTDFGCLLELLH